MDFSDVLIQKVAQLGSLGVVQEINLRILADKTPKLKDLAHAQRLEDLEAALFLHFSDYITDEETVSIKAGRVIRNKILHANFEAASAKAAATELGLIQNATVKKMDLNSGTIENAQDLSIHEAGIFGWLLVCSNNGFFKAAEVIFQRNIKAIIRLNKDLDAGTNSKPIPLVPS